MAIPDVTPIFLNGECSELETFREINDDRVTPLSFLGNQGE